MKNTLLQFINLTDLLKASWIAFLRFPLPILVALSVALLMIGQNHHLGIAPESLELSLSFGFFLLVGAQIFSEHFPQRWPRAALSLAALGLTAAHYYWIEFANKNWPHWLYPQVLLFFGAAAIVVVLALGLRQREAMSFRARILSLITAAAYGLLYAVVLLLCVLGLIFAVDKLFELHFNRLYGDFTAVIMIFLMPVFVLSKIPKIDESTEYHEGRAAEVLFLYILIPTLWLYSGILYAYFLRILVLQRWPEGIVANIIIWYSLVGILVLFFSQGLRQRFRSAQIFQQVFPFVLILPCIVLFMAIFVRHAHYGLTLWRVILIYAAVFLGASVVYLCLRRQRRDYRSLLAFALVMAISAAAGPLSAKALSLRSQVARIQSLIHENSAAADVNTWHKVEAMQAKRLSDSLRYLRDADLWEDAGELVAGLSKDNLWEETQKMLENVSEEYVNSQHLLLALENAPLNIGGSRFMQHFNQFMWREDGGLDAKGNVTLHLAEDGEGITLHFSILTIAEKYFYKPGLRPAMKKSQYIKEDGKYLCHAEDLSLFTVANGRLLRVVFHELSFSRDKGEDFHNISVEGYVFWGWDYVDALLERTILTALLQAAHPRVVKP
ncbi:MAG: DUF4153 domain-containing protein [Bradymonadales bacterium]|jgi:hypothetical protein